MSKYTSEEIEANTSNIGIKLYNKLVKSTSLKLKEMDNREIWSVKAKACIYGLSDSEQFKESYDTLPKYKSRLGNQFDYIFEDNMYLWYWLATGCVISMVALHYRIMYRTGMRSLYGQQSRNIGETFVGSRGLKWSDEAYDILGDIAKTAVVLGELPIKSEKNTDNKKRKGTESGAYSELDKGRNFRTHMIVPSERSFATFVDKEKFPKEPCVGVSDFFLENETQEQYADTSDTIWGLYWLFRVVEMEYPKISTKEWMDNDGYSIEKE